MRQNFARSNILSTFVLLKVLSLKAGPLPYECNFKIISKQYVKRDPVKSGMIGTGLLTGT